MNQSSDDIYTLTEHTGAKWFREGEWRNVACPAAAFTMTRGTADVHDTQSW